MKFGIFYELSVPKPWDRESERRVFMNALEQVELADQLGFDQVWAVEHHFLEEYSHCSAPEIFLTACAMRTKNIRIGHGVMLVLPPFNHPIRCAERAASLDIFSGGRLEFGTGRSTTWTELGGFRADPDLTKDMWDEAVHAIPQMWMKDVFSWEGKYFSAPPRNVLPKPYQRPHPPIWVAVSSPETAIQAAERGIGCLGVSIGSPQEQEERVKKYHHVLQTACNPVGAFVNEQVNTLNWLYCDENPQEAARWGKKLIYTFNYLANQFVAIKQAYPTKSYTTPGLIFSLRRESTTASGEANISPGLGLGDPDHLIQAMKRWESTGVDRVCFLLNANEVIPQEKVLNSLRTFARYVMPEFKNSTLRVSAPQPEAVAAAD
ncbi:MAG: LLM class flavin-dependent oxidoreductase [Deltaproteobacteria bacterium]|nr:LLM class flavin-dependent oxidoreductase [Deltaproteobacteria bacterium]